MNIVHGVVALLLNAWFGASGWLSMGSVMEIVASPSGSVATQQIVLRWIHTVAGITWIGLLYFFNLVNIPFMQELDTSTRARVFPALMSRALWWFRWSALVTVLAGIWYWMMIIGADVRAARAIDLRAAASTATAQFPTVSGGHSIGSFFILWTAAFIVCFVVVCVLKANSPIVVGVVYALSVSTAAFLYVRFNHHGWESDRLLAIGVGGGMGWMMLLNVWGIIWRFGKKMIRWTEASAANGAPVPPDAAALARQIFLVSRANFVLSLPMLFFMGAASHFPG